MSRRAAPAKRCAEPRLDAASCPVKGGASEAMRPAVTREPLQRVHPSVARHPTPHARHKTLTTPRAPRDPLPLHPAH